VASANIFHIHDLIVTDNCNVKRKQCLRFLKQHGGLHLWRILQYVMRKCVITCPLQQSRRIPVVITTIYHGLLTDVFQLPFTASTMTSCSHYDFRVLKLNANFKIHQGCMISCSDLVMKLHEHTSIVRNESLFVVHLWVVYSFSDAIFSIS